MSLTPTGMPRLVGVLSLLVGIAAAVYAVLAGPDFGSVALALNGLLGFALLWLASDATDHLAKINEFTQSTYDWHTTQPPRDATKHLATINDVLEETLEWHRRHPPQGPR